MRFEGIIAAMITPFTKDDMIDEEGLRRNIEFLEKNEIDAIVPCGTTGESATLSHDEHKKVIKIATETAHVPVLAGTGSNSTKEAIDQSCSGRNVVHDYQILPILSLGGKGVISVAANIIPRKLKEMYDSFIKGDIDRAREIHYNLSPLFRALFIETNPIPIKAACNMMGLAAGNLRPPLANLSKEHEDILKTILKKYLKE